MIALDLVANPLFPRAVIVGLFGAVGLALTPAFTRRGPMILPVYAALLIALTALAARYSTLAFSVRALAIFTAFSLASFALYVANGVLADRDRQRSVARGHLPRSALAFRLSVFGHAWRMAALAAVGAVLSAAGAFVAG